MAVYIPDQDELYARLMAKQASFLKVPVSELGPKIQVECQVLSAELWPIYLRISEAQNNQYVQLADKEYLRRIGIAWLNRDISPAVQGKYYVTVTSSNGAIIDKDTIFQSNTDSTSPKKLFATDYGYSTAGDPGNDIDPLPNPTGQILLRALDYGLVSRLEIGDKLTSIQPLTLAKDEVVVESIFRAPESEESEESYRAAVLNARRTNARVYTSSLVRLWCSEISEISKIYVYNSLSFDGSLTIFAEATKENSDVIVGQPTQSVLDQIYKFDNGFETGVIIRNEATGADRKDYSFTNYVVQKAICRKVDVFFTGLSDITKSSLLKDSFSNLFYTIRPFIAASDSISEINDTLSTPLVLASAFTALSGLGVSFTGITIKVDDVETDIFKFMYGDYPYLGNVFNNGDPI